MAYTTSTSVATLDIFITAVTSFAVSYAGFTSEGNFTDSGTKVTIISKGGYYWSFYQITHRGVYVSSNDFLSIDFRITFAKPTTLAEVTTNAGPLAQTRSTVFKNTTGPYTKYYLYTEGTCVHCVLEVYSGIFSHLSFGSITKLGTWTGGQYTTGTGAYYWNGGFVSGLTNWNSLPFNGNASSTYYEGGTVPGYVRRINGTANGDETDFARIGGLLQNDQQAKMNVASDMLTGIHANSPNQFNLRSPAFPMYTRIWNSTKASYGLQGYVPDVSAINIENIASGATIETEWQAFPVIQRTTGDSALAPITDNYGLMYKKVAPAV